MLRSGSQLPILPDSTDGKRNRHVTTAAVTVSRIKKLLRPAAQQARESVPGRNIMSMALASQLRQLASIEVLDSDPAIPDRKLTGTVHKHLNEILTLLTEEEIAASAAVRVQTKDLLTIGKVLRCIPEVDAKWTIYVGVTRSMLIV